MTYTDTTGETYRLHHRDDHGRVWMQRLHTQQTSDAGQIRETWGTPFTMDQDHFRSLTPSPDANLP